MSEEIKDDGTSISAAKMLEELKRENAKMMDEHKRAIEAKYEAQMQEFLQKLAPPPRGSTRSKQATNVLEALKNSRPVISVDEADFTTERFYAMSQTESMQPEIRMYEEGRKRQLVRASMEDTKQIPVVVKVTGEEEVNSEFLASMAGKGVSRRKEKEKAKEALEKSLPTTLQNNPLSNRVAPPVWQGVIDKKKEAADSMKQRASKEAKEAKAAAMEERKARKEVESKENKGEESEGEEEEEREEDNFRKFDPSTQYMIKKTDFLVKQAQSAIFGDMSGSGANVARRKKRMLKTKRQREAKAAAAAAKEREADNTRNMESTLPSGSPSSSPNRNILVQSIEVGDDLPPLAAGGGPDGEESAYHPDYEEHVYHEDGTGQRVNEYEYDIDPHLALKKSDWENEIARHILSVYATEKSKVDVKSSKAIMSMVDTEQTQTKLDTVLDYIRSEDGRRRDANGELVEGDKEDLEEAVDGDDDEEEDRASIAELVAGGGSVAGEGMGELYDDEEVGGLEGAADTRTPRKKKGKIKKIKAKAHKFKQSKEEAATTYRNAKKAAEDEASQLTDEVQAARDDMVTTAAQAGLAFKDEESFTNHSKFRNCITVRVGRTGNGPGVSEYNPGEIISIRGSPRVFPIWFVSSGEIYSNWAKLPGGEELQAQLANLYERRRFKEYLGIVEKIIDDMWRDRSLGKIEGIDNFLNKRVSTRRRVEMREGVRLVGKDGKLLPRTDGKEIKRKKKTIEPKLETFKPNAGEWGDENPQGNVWDQIAAHEQHVEKLAAELSDEELISLWGQLILTANAFGVLCIEKKAYDMALEILNKAEKWSRRTDILPKKQRAELAPHILDAMAFYFYKRGKNMSSMSYTKMALKDHEELQNLDYICIDKLHMSAILSQSGHFKEAHKLIFEVLAMVEDGRLAMEEATPRQLCLVAIAYHNLAVVQLKLLVPDLAAKNSQNARKISRLCLSYSNRWMQVFEWTHEVAMEDIKFQLTHKPAIPLNEKQLFVIKELTEDMYDPLQS